MYIPIPLSSKKLRTRGYNQSELLAKELVTRIGGEVQSILSRTLDTKPQYGLSREERKANIKGAFALKRGIVIPSEQRESRNLIMGIQKSVERDSSTRPSDLVGRTESIVFLVDDVVTTGSTLVEAANMLKRHGFKNVWAVTLAQD